MKNNYEVRGEITAIIIQSPKYGRLEALISTNKLETAKEMPYTWTASWREDVQTFYILGKFKDVGGKRKGCTLHRWVMKVEKGYEVDHFNHDGLNNTNKNLRILTSCENKQNRKGARVDSQSGVRGVGWSKQAGLWLARIRINNKRIYVGHFKNLSEAEKAVKTARIKYMPYTNEASA